MNFEQLNNYPLNQKYHDDGQYIIVQLLLFNSIVDPNHNQQFATMTQATMIQTTMNPSHRGVGFNNSLHARGAQRPRALATWPPGRRPVRFDPNHNDPTINQNRLNSSIFHCSIITCAMAKWKLFS